MKDYRRLVFWLDYFNSALSRRDGRRVPFSHAVRSPSLSELEAAARKLDLEPEAVQAFHPKRSHVPSGYVSVRRTARKDAVLRMLAAALASVRGEQKQEKEGRG